MAVKPAAARRSSLLSDELLRQLIAAGQADIVVGVPTLDNAATVGPVVAAAQRAAASTVAHRRVLVFNSDGGSTDGTPQVVAEATAGAQPTVTASHSLRTIHRIVAPYHGLPGRRNAVRTIFAVANLLQARAAIIVDPNTLDPSPDVFAALIGPVMDEGADVVALAPDRDPREGPLVTQVVRPLLIGALGASFDDPVGTDIAVSPRYLADMLAQPYWDDEPLRPGIDLWLRVHALVSGAQTLQVATAPRAHGPTARVPLRDIVQQVLRATWRCIDIAAPRAAGSPARAPATRRLTSGAITEPDWALEEFERTFRDAARDLAPLWRAALAGPLVDALCSAAASTPTHIPDAVWADVLVATARAAAAHPRPDDLARAFVPIYLGRVASFMRDVRGLTTEAVHTRLDAMTGLLVARRDDLTDPRAPRAGGS